MQEQSQDDGCSRRNLLTAAAVGAGVLAIQRLTGCTSPGTEPSTDKTETLEKAAGAVVLTVNGQRRELNLDPRVTLLDALRDDLQLTGTKKGCDHGQCGACTVLIDNRRVNSCLTLAVAAQNKSITTIEGLATGDHLHPMQAAFVQQDAFQCGYCTPGQICSAVGLLHEAHPPRNDDEIREGMAGNICRCGAYPNIVAAVRQVLNTNSNNA